MFEGFDEAYQERLQKANEVVLDALKRLDHTSPTYNEDLEAVQKLAETVKADFKNYADIDAEKVRSLYEKERARNDLIDSMLRGLFSLVGFIGGISMFRIDLKNRNMRIDKVARFEEKDAILKTADRIAVSDALKEDRKSFFSFPFFWK